MVHSLDSCGTARSEEAAPPNDALHSSHSAPARSHHIATPHDDESARQKDDESARQSEADLSSGRVDETDSTELVMERWDGWTNGQMDRHTTMPVAEDSAQPLSIAVRNLTNRFPAASKVEVLQALKMEHGHAGHAARLLTKFMQGTLEAPLATIMEEASRVSEPVAEPLHERNRMRDSIELELEWAVGVAHTPVTADSGCARHFAPANHVAETVSHPPGVSSANSDHEVSSSHRVLLRNTSMSFPDWIARVHELDDAMAVNVQGGKESSRQRAESPSSFKPAIENHRDVDAAVPQDQQRPTDPGQMWNDPDPMSTDPDQIWRQIYTGESNQRPARHDAESRPTDVERTPGDLVLDVAEPDVDQSRHDVDRLQHDVGAWHVPASETPLEAGLALFDSIDLHSDGNVSRAKLIEVLRCDSVYSAALVDQLGLAMGQRDLQLDELSADADEPISRAEWVHFISSLERSRHNTVNPDTVYGEAPVVAVEDWSEVLAYARNEIQRRGGSKWSASVLLRDWAMGKRSTREDKSSAYLLGHLNDDASDDGDTPLAPPRVYIPLHDAPAPAALEDNATVTGAQSQCTVGTQTISDTGAVSAVSHKGVPKKATQRSWPWTVFQPGMQPEQQKSFDAVQVVSSQTEDEPSQDQSANLVMLV